MGNNTHQSPTILKTPLVGRDAYISRCEKPIFHKHVLCFLHSQKILRLETLEIRVLFCINVLPKEKEVTAARVPNYLTNISFLHGLIIRHKSEMNVWKMGPLKEKYGPHK